MDQKRTADLAVQRSSRPVMTRFPGHLQNPFTDSHTRFVPGLRNISGASISYKLSPQYDIPTLKTLALDHIRGELAKCDIVEEAFSGFASR